MLGRKGSARGLYELRESSEWEAGTFRHQCRAPVSASNPRTGRAQFQASDIWPMSQGGCVWNDVSKARGASGPPRAGVPNGGLGLGRVRSLLLKKASGAWNAGLRRDRTQITNPKKGVTVDGHSHLHKSQRGKTQSTRAQTRACSSHTCVPLAHSLTQVLCSHAACTRKTAQHETPACARCSCLLFQV